MASAGGIHCLLLLHLPRLVDENFFFLLSSLAPFASWKKQAKSSTCITFLTCPAGSEFESVGEQD